MPGLAEQPTIGAGLHEVDAPRGISPPFAPPPPPSPPGGAYVRTAGPETPLAKEVRELEELRRRARQARLQLSRGRDASRAKDYDKAVDRFDTGLALACGIEQEMQLEQQLEPEPEPEPGPEPRPKPGPEKKVPKRSSGKRARRKMLEMETELKQTRSLNAKLLAELTSQAEAAKSAKGPGKLRRLFRRKSETKPKGPEPEAQPLPAGWEEQQSRANGDKYYLNVVSNESTFELPRTASLPTGWKHYRSRRDAKLFFISPTGETTFDPPPTHTTTRSRGPTSAAPAAA